MTGLAAVLLQGALVATGAAAFLAAAVGWTRLPPRVESLLWIAVAARFLLPPLVPIGVAGHESRLVPPREAAAPWSATTADAPRPEGRLAAESITGSAAYRGAAERGSEATRAPRRSAASGLVVIWLGSALLVLALRLWRARIWFHRRRTAPAPESLRAMVTDVAGSMGVRTPELLLDLDLASPMVTGLRRPVLRWPARLLPGLSEMRARSLVAHELAHLRHRDLWVGLLELAAGSVWWWYPGWYVVRGRLGNATERACDARVVSLYPALRRDYAEALLDVASLAAVPVPSTARATDGAEQVRRRLEGILTPRRARSRLATGCATCAVVLATSLGWTRDDTPFEPARPASQAEGGRSSTGIPRTSSRTSVVAPSAAAIEPPAVASASGETAAARPPEAEAELVVEIPSSQSSRRSAASQAKQEGPSGLERDLARRLASSHPSTREAAVGTIGRERLLEAFPLVYPLAADTSPRVRWQVAASIGLAEPYEGISTLMSLLGDPEPAVRESAAWALGEYEGRQLEATGAVSPLLRLARDPDAGVRRQLAASLAITEVAQGVPVLLDLLADEEPAVRATAVWGLGELKRRDLTTRLLRLADDPVPDVRRAVALALVRLPAEDWRATLERMIHDRDPHIGRTAALALSQLSDS